MDSCRYAYMWSPTAWGGGACDVPYKQQVDALNRMRDAARGTPVCWYRVEEDVQFKERYDLDCLTKYPDLLVQGKTLWQSLQPPPVSDSSFPTVPSTSDSSTLPPPTPWPTWKKVLLGVGLVAVSAGVIVVVRKSV
jgi:hypothetical protein